MALLKKIGDEFSKRVCLNVYVRNIVFDSRFPFSPKRETITCTKDGRSLSSHSYSVGNTVWNYLHFFFNKKTMYHIPRFRLPASCERTSNLWNSWKSTMPPSMEPWMPKTSMLAVTARGLLCAFSAWVMGLCYRSNVVATQTQDGDFFVISSLDLSNPLYLQASHFLSNSLPF